MEVIWHKINEVNRKEHRIGLRMGKGTVLKHFLLASSILNYWLRNEIICDSHIAANLGCCL